MEVNADFDGGNCSKERGVRRYLVESIWTPICKHVFLHVYKDYTRVFKYFYTVVMEDLNNI